MRIALVSEHASPLAVIGGTDAGGQNVHVAALATALGARGHAVTVYTRRDDPTIADRVTLTRGVVVEHLPAGPPRPVPKDELLPHVDALAEALRRRLAADRPDVVHAHFWMSGLAAVAAAAAVDVPVVQTFHALGAVKRRHQGRQDTSPAQRIAAEQFLSRRVARVIATCSDEVAELLRAGAPRAGIDVVPCGVDTTVFRPDGPVAARTERPRLLVVSRLVPRKGVDDAIDALAALCGQASAAGAGDSGRPELLVAGGPHAAELHADPEAVRLQRRAERAGVADRVHLLGRVDRRELPALVRSADTVLCLPWYEPFGIVPLEAMACGVPVVGTAVGGLLDSVVDGATGRLVPPRRPAAAADAVAQLLADPAARIAMGHAALARTRARYGWDRVAAATEATYQQVVAEDRRRSGSRADAGVSEAG
ncbi:MAG: glycosyltransferase [bacterium]